MRRKRGRLDATFVEKVVRLPEMDNNNGCVSVAGSMHCIFSAWCYMCSLFQAQTRESNNMVDAILVQCSQLSMGHQTSPVANTFILRKIEMARCF